MARLRIAPCGVCLRLAPRAPASGRLRVPRVVRRDASCALRAACRDVRARAARASYWRASHARVFRGSRCKPERVLPSNGVLNFYQFKSTEERVAAGSPDRVILFSLRWLFPYITTRGIWTPVLCPLYWPTVLRSRPFSHNIPASTTPWFGAISFTHTIDKQGKWCKP